MSNVNKSRVFIALLMLVVFSTSFSFAQDSMLTGRKESVAASPSSEKLGLKDDLEINGNKIELKAGMRPADVSRGGLFLVQFGTELSDSLESWLVANGAEVHDYAGANSYWVKARPGSNFWSNSAINAVARPTAAAKMDPLLSAVLKRREATREIKVIAVLVPGTSQDMVDALLADSGAQRLSSSVDNGRLFLKLPASAVSVISASDNVMTVEMMPFGKKLHNNKSANLIGVQKARVKYKLSGDGVKVGIVDGGEVDSNHKEFSGRLTSMTKKDVSDHSTHVAGSIGSAGKNKGSKGMAYESEIYSYDFYGNIPVVIKGGKVQKGIDVFNNSWGWKIGWEYDGIYLPGWGFIWSWYGDSLFGRYTSESRAYDANIRGKNINVVFSAGNDRNDGPGLDYFYYDVAKDVIYYGWFYGEEDTWKTIGPTGSSKNVLTVGATNGKANMSEFSSWGPTADGRVKPEVTAPGVSIFSTMPKGQYGRMSGTSMAAPITTGSIALIIEHWRNQFDEDPNPEVIRALVAATATDLGTKGPDYKFGFGALNMAEACKFINDNDEKQLIVQTGIKRGKSNVYDLTIGSSKYKEMRVVVAWLDPAGPSLVNDLDVTVTSPKGKKYKAWGLNPGNPGVKAKQIGNYRDNIEVVTVNKPYASDEWQIQIDASLKKGSKQRYCLLIYLK